MKAELDLDRYLKYADHIIFIPGLGKAPLEGSLEQLQTRDLILPLGHKDDRLSARILSHPTSELTERPDAVGREIEPAGQNIAITPTTVADKMALAHYLKSFGYYNSVIFCFLSILCVGSYKASGKATPPLCSTMILTNTGRLLASSLDREQHYYEQLILCWDICATEHCCAYFCVLLVHVSVQQLLFTVYSTN
jgi:hypothetical protein